MALNVDLREGDELVVPAGAHARIQVLAKSGRRTRLSIDSDAPVQVRRASASINTAQKCLDDRGTHHG